jgi:hypothetical protein
MEYEPLDESQRINKSVHEQFNDSIRAGEIVVLTHDTLQYADGSTETSRVYNYIFDEETGDYHRVALSREEYYKKHGRGILGFFRRK